MITLSIPLQKTPKFKPGDIKYVKRQINGVEPIYFVQCNDNKYFEIDDIDKHIRTMIKSHKNVKHYPESMIMLIFGDNLVKPEYDDGIPSNYTGGDDNVSWLLCGLVVQKGSEYCIYCRRYLKQGSHFFSVEPNKEPDSRYNLVSFSEMKKNVTNNNGTILMFMFMKSNCVSQFQKLQVQNENVRKKINNKRVNIYKNQKKQKKKNQKKQKKKNYTNDQNRKRKVSNEMTSVTPIFVCF